MVPVKTFFFNLKGIIILKNNVYDIYIPYFVNIWKEYSDKRELISNTRFHEQNKGEAFKASPLWAKQQ